MAGSRGGAGESDILKLVLAQLDDFVTIWDRNKRLLFVNEKLEKLLGQTREDYQGKSVAEQRFSPGGRQFFTRHLDSVLASGRSETGRRTYVSLDGPEHDYEFLFNPIFGENGEIEFVAVVSRDMTALARVEEAQQESDKQFRLLFDSIDQAFCLLEVVFDERGKPCDFRHLKTNPAFTRQTGIDDAEGRLVSEVVPGLLERWRDVWVQVWETGEAVHYVNDGRSVGRWYDTAVFRMEGSRTRLGILFEDITEQVQAQRRLRESEQRYRSLTRLCPDAMMVELDGRYVFANPAACRLLAASSEAEILNRPPAHFILPDCLPKVAARRQRVLTDECYLPLHEIGMRRLDGQRIDVEVAIGHIKWEGSHAIQIVVRDITQRKQAEKELREADRHKNIFLATLAHELRNPLAPIQSGLDVLGLASNDPRILRDSLDMMKRQVNHLVHLVDDLLDISRISRGKISLRREKVDLRESVNKAVEATSFLTRAGRRRLKVRCPDDEVLVEADPVRLVQIIANLLSNAGKYTSEDGQIEISVEKRQDWACIQVRDDGLGIEKAMQNRLFQMFVQVDSGGGGGLGIGLALVRSLVEMHGGRVAVHSEGLGHGSVFSVELPLAEGRTLAETADKKPASLRAQRVLVVDDNVDAAVSLGLLLQLLGAEVRTTHDGQSALAIVEDFHPDLVLLDLGMPGMDGYETGRRLRETEAGRRTRLIALTGWGQDEDRRRTASSGFDEHMVKPVDLQALQALFTRAPRSPVALLPQGRDQSMGA